MLGRKVLSLYLPNMEMTMSYQRRKLSTISYYYTFTIMFSLVIVVIKLRISTKSTEMEIIKMIMRKFINSNLFYCMIWLLFFSFLMTSARNIQMSQISIVYFGCTGRTVWKSESVLYLKSKKMHSQIKTKIYNSMLWKYSWNSEKWNDIIYISYSL